MIRIFLRLERGALIRITASAWLWRHLSPRVRAEVALRHMIHWPPASQTVSADEVFFGATERETVLALRRALDAWGET